MKTPKPRKTLSWLEAQLSQNAAAYEEMRQFFIKQQADLEQEVRRAYYHGVQQGREQALRVVRAISDLDAKYNEAGQTIDRLIRELREPPFNSQLVARTSIGTSKNATEQTLAKISTK